MKMSKDQQSMTTTSSGKVDLIDLRRVEFDRSYQREVKYHSTRISKKFRAELVGTPILAKRSDGRLLCIDGQQRITAMLNKGILYWECLVVPSQGTEHEADLFVRFNKDRVNVTPNETFKGRVAANDADAVGVVEILKRLGFVVDLTPVKRSKLREPGKTPICFETMYSIYQFHGPEVLERVMRLIKRTWPDSGEMLEAWVVKAVTMMVTRKDHDFNDDNFFRKLSKCSPMSLQQKSKGDPQGKVKGLVRIMVPIYNHSLRNRMRFDD